LRSPLIHNFLAKVLISFDSRSYSSLLNLSKFKKGLFLAIPTLTNNHNFDLVLLSLFLPDRIRADALDARSKDRSLPLQASCASVSSAWWHFSGRQKTTAEFRSGGWMVTQSNAALRNTFCRRNGKFVYHYRIWRKLSHAEFILSYQNGALGCAVRTPRALPWFLSHHVRDPKAQQTLLVCLIVVSALIGGSIFLLFYLSRFWVIAGLVLGLPAFVLVLMHRVAELVIDLALNDERFFATASAEGVLIVCADDGENLHTIPILIYKRSHRHGAEKKNHHNRGS
jgi:hypothetical protein